MSDYSHLAGRRFPAQQFRLAEHTAALWAHAVLADAPSSAAHPTLGYLLAIRGGVSIAEVFELLDTSVDAGVLFGECALDFAAPLVAGANYEIDGRILSVERKAGKRSGPFDRLVFEVRIREPGSDETVCTNTNTWIIPRPQERSG